MMESLGKGVTSGEIPDDPGSPLAQPFLDTLEIQDHLLSQISEITTDTSAYRGKFQLTADKGGAYRLAGYYPEALTEFQNMLTWAYTEDQPLVDYWICVVDFEQNETVRYFKVVVD